MSASSKRTHHHCGACDRLTALRDRADPHTLALLVVKLEDEVQRLQRRNAKMQQSKAALERQLEVRQGETQRLEAAVEQLQGSLKETANRLLEMQLKREAEEAGITHPDAVKAYARAESPKRLAKVLTPVPGGSPEAAHAPSPLPSFVSTCVSEVESGMAADKDVLQETITGLNRSLEEVSTERDELGAMLRTESDRRVQAEAAYKYLQEQTQPLRTGFTRMATDARREVREHARALELNAAMVAEFARVVTADIKSHFGYLPLAMENKISSLVENASVVPMFTHSSMQA